jgi:hypothetical protein
VTFLVTFLSAQILVDILAADILEANIVAEILVSLSMELALMLPLRVIGGTCSTFSAALSPACPCLTSLTGAGARACGKISAIIQPNPIQSACQPPQDSSGPTHDDSRLCAASAPSRLSGGSHCRDVFRNLPKWTPCHQEKVQRSVPGLPAGRDA